MDLTEKLEAQGYLLRVLRDDVRHYRAGLERVLRRWSVRNCHAEARRYLDAKGELPEWDDARIPAGVP